jgi:hypothetical protein
VRSFLKQKKEKDRMNELSLNQVKEKLNKEAAESKLSGAANVVLEPVKNALLEFCKQEKEFSQAILENDKKITDCCAEITKGVGNAVSDLEIYKRAVQFYFPGADIEFQMKIDLCASVKDNSKSDIKISLMDLI